jgi:hypothetical protein
MLEDELREAFAAAVRTPPAVAGPADQAIRKGRAMARRRRTLSALAGLTVFVAALGGAAGARWGDPVVSDDRISYQGLYGTALSGGADHPAVVETRLPPMKMPVDVRVGDQLYTIDGTRVTLTGAGEVDRVVRVPVGWVYSDGQETVRLATAGGETTQLLSEQTSWEVDAAGARIASITQGVLRIRPVQTPSEAKTATDVAGDDTSVSTAVPAETEVVGFAGAQVVVSRTDRVAFDFWSASGRTPYTEIWNGELKAVFSNGLEPIVGLVDGQHGSTCLVEVGVVTGGLRIGRQLGCDGMFAVANGRIVVSPDGLWLSVGAPAGVHLVDLAQSRDRAGQTINGASQVTVAATCAAMDTSPVVWADRRTVLVVSQQRGVVACRTDGSRHEVALPAGVTSGWELVPVVSSLIDD